MHHWRPCVKLRSAICYQSWLLRTRSVGSGHSGEEKRSDRRQSGSFFLAENFRLCSEIVGVRGCLHQDMSTEDSDEKTCYNVVSFGSGHGPLTKILMSTHENLMRFSWENENCQRFSWESHELFTKSHENLTRFSFSRENWNVFSWDFLTFMSFSWDFSWASHEILVSLFSRENWNAFSWESHENVTRFSWAFLGVFSWKLWIWRLMLALNSHEILTRLKFSHEILMRVQWSHELLTRFSWGSHKILMRISRDSYEILTRFRYTGITNTNPIHPFFSSTFFFVRLATFCEVTLAAKKSTTSSASISIKTCWSQTATVSFKHFHWLYSQHLIIN